MKFKKFKKIIAPIAAAVLAVTLTACGSTKSENSAEKIKITTNKGEVEVTKNPKNVAVYDVAVLDMMQRYGIKVDNLLTPKISAKYVADLAKGNDKGGSLKEPNLEEISKFKPDVLFASGRQAKFLDELKKISTVAFFNDSGEDYFGNMMKNNEEIAKVFGVEDKVKADKEKFEKKIKEISDRMKASNKKALVIMTNEGKISAFGKGSRFGFVHDLFGFAPADPNIEVSRHGKEINYEYISKINPDIIIYVDRNSVVKSKTDATATKTLDNELIKATKAMKNGEVYELDAQYAYLAGDGLTAFEKIMEVLEKASKK